MSKEFNTTGTCIPEVHYMVDTSNKLAQIRELIDRKKYFTINRGRQYGKTTTLAALRRLLAAEYTVISTSFQGVGNDSFANEEAFCQTFLHRIKKQLRFSGATEVYKDWDQDVRNLDELSDLITERCINEKIVLMIDEVDQASDFRTFLRFLSMLRDKFLWRNEGLDATFHSVVLAGVYDIKNIKLKMIDDGFYQPVEGERKIASPWNIAISFDVEMSFCAEEIATMLVAYERDYHTGMDIQDISEEIYGYTNGYPFLVSQVCKHIHEKLGRDWTRLGVSEAVKLMIEDPAPTTLFDDLFKNMKNNEELSNFLYDILLAGKKYRFARGIEVIDIGLRYAFISVINREIQIHNKIFEVLITDYFIEKESISENKTVKNDVAFEVLHGGEFNIELFFEKFNDHYQRNYAIRDIKFLEREAAFLFLFFLQPYLNGKGAYFLENQTKSGERMDVVIVFGGKEFIVELKIWKGSKLHYSGQKQLLRYMEKRGVDKGYLLTFDFRQKREQKQEWIYVDGKALLDVQV